MNRVLLFAGTTEGRSLAEFLERLGVPALVCVATEYGESLLEETALRSVRTGRMDAWQMEELMGEEAFAAAVDATHPYAAAVSCHIRSACQTVGLPYLRVSRKGEDTGRDCVQVDTAGEAVEYLSGTEGNIFLTTGSKDLETFAKLPDFHERVYARVLSTGESVAHCARLGLQGKHLICMQGPFGEDLNEAMMRHVDAKWLVTKESGKPGGFEEKIRSAAKVGAGVVVIGRPKEDGPSEEVQESGLGEMEVRQKLCQMMGVSAKRRIDLIGIGMGTVEGMTGEALAACQNAQVLIGAQRMITMAEVFDKPSFVSYRPEEIRDYIHAHPEYERIGLLLSGDVGFYSGAGGLLEVLKGEEVRLYPGISSAAALCARGGTPWEDVKLMSLHGRNQNLIGAVKRSKKVFALIGKAEGVNQLCEKLTEYGLTDVQLTVGERLSYPQERITTGTPGELSGRTYDSLCAVLIRNEKAREIPVHGLEDQAFLRGKVPMTKAEVRSISLSKLRLSRDAVAYDVGAGTGSLSVEMALQAWDGHVYAVEKNPEAAALIRENKRSFGADNLTVLEGTAPEALFELPAPTHVFVGGSSGNLKEILLAALEKNPGVRVVINAIALETVGEALECLKTLPFTETDVVAVSSARAKGVGRYHMMMGQNPVYIISCTGGDSHE